MQCAPSKGNQKYTCYSLDSLKKIAKEYNRKYGRPFIKIKDKSRIQLWQDIRKRLSDRCNSNDSCWIEQDFVKNTNNNEILNNTFKPKMPNEWKNDMTIWLNTDDIDNIMKQYEKKYKNFFFVGPVPIDCNINGNLMCQLTNFNVNKMYKRGINKIGIIYNTDTSNGPGEHWQSVFCDISRKKITFFDSYASKPSDEIMYLMKKLQYDLKNGKNNIMMDIEWNKKRHQYDGYNCGMYSMFFIIQMLEGKTLSQINRMKLDTNKMQKLKKIYYRL